MYFGDLTYTEIKKYAENDTIVIIPTGCTEQQGLHLPVDFDTWFSENISLAASEYASEEYDLESLVLPACPFGPTPEHRNFGSGYIHLPKQLHDELILALLESLFEQGFSRMMIWRGCGQHDFSRIVEQFNQKYSGRAKVFQPAFMFNQIWCRIGDDSIPGGHADSFATSIALYKRPGDVRLDQIINPENKTVDWDDHNLDFSKYSKTGVIGDPTHATPELGARLWHELIREFANMIKAFSEISLS